MIKLWHSLVGVIRGDKVKSRVEENKSAAERLERALNGVLST